MWVLGRGHVGQGAFALEFDEVIGGYAGCDCEEKAVHTLLLAIPYA